MKRFTETLKWNDPWFRKLKPEAKLLWYWILDNCDAAGVIEPDMELATFQIGMPMGIDTLSQLGDRVEKLTDTKFKVSKFITFQYGELSRECRAHNAVFQSLERHSIGYPKGIKRVQDITGQDKDKDKQGVGGESKRPSQNRPSKK